MSFDPFGDFETAGYLQNSLGLKDPTEVKESEHLSFELSIEDALICLAKENPINYQTFLKIHLLLFYDFYPWAGQDRNKIVPHLAIFKGSLADPDKTLFERPDLIERSMTFALGLTANKRRIRENPGEVLGLFAFAHPFLDGNGRTILLVFMELAYRAKFAIDWSKTNKDEYLRALSCEIRDPAKRHLDHYLKPFIVNISSRKQWPDIIGGIQGLNGLDSEVLTYESLDNLEIQKAYNSYKSRPCYVSQPVGKDT